jgi:hypothetical protein
LRRVGFVAINNSVYFPPKNDQTLEDFQRIAREVTEGQGDAVATRGCFVEGLSESQIEALFRGGRDANFAAIANKARELSKPPPCAPPTKKLEAS